MRQSSTTTHTRRPTPLTTGGTGTPPIWTRADTGARRNRPPTPPVATWRRSFMYFPDNFAALAALSEHAHRFVLRWRTAARGRADDRFIHSQDRRRNTGSASSQERP